MNLKETKERVKELVKGYATGFHSKKLCEYENADGHGIPECAMQLTETDIMIIIQDLFNKIEILEKELKK